MRNTLWVAVTAAMVAIGCGGGATGPEFGSADSQLIRQRTQDYAAAFNAKDAEKVLTFHSPEAIFMPPNAPVVRGREAIGDQYKKMFSEDATQLKMESTDIGGHGPIAYEGGTFSMNRRPADGPDTRDRGKYLFIWRKGSGDAWQIQYTIWSSDLPERMEIAPAR